VLLNIASFIFLLVRYLNLPYELGMILVVVYFLFELFIFFTYLVWSPGILMLFIIFFIPYYLFTDVKIKDIPQRLKCNIANISVHLEDKKTKNDPVSPNFEEIKSQ
jgi:hypothetical protein